MYQNLLKLKIDQQNDIDDINLYVDQNIQQNVATGNIKRGNDYKVFDEIKSIATTKCGNLSNIQFYPKCANPFTSKYPNLNK